MRKITALIGIGILLCFVLIGCGKNHVIGSESLVSPNGDEKPEPLKIIVDSRMWDGTAMGASYFREYQMKFEQSFGVKVEVLTIDEKMEKLDSSEAYCNRWSEAVGSMLTQKNGPDLIAVGNVCASRLIDRKLVIPCYDQIENTKNIYFGLQDEKKYFVPVQFYGATQIMRKSELIKISKKIPSFDWTPEEYYNLYFKWLNKSGRALSEEDLNLATYMDIKGESWGNDVLSGKINTIALKKKIMKVRENLFSGGAKYNKEYKLKNYENLFFDSKSKEHTSMYYWQYDDQKRRGTCLEQGYNQETTSLFRVAQIKKEMESGDFVVLPVPEDRTSILPWGFMISKNANNSALAQAFVNGLLSDEVQYTIFSYGRDSGMGFPYPVVETIENRILGDEHATSTYDYAFQLKKYGLEKLKKEKVFMLPVWETKKDEFLHGFIKDWIKLIFDDNFSEKGLDKKLEKLELKYSYLHN